MKTPKFMEPIDLIEGDQPNVCPFDGARTSLYEIRDDYTIENCPMCGKLFNFWHDTETDD